MNEFLNQPFVTILLAGLLTMASTAVGLWFGRRQQMAQTQKTVADAQMVNAMTAEKIQEIYQEMVNDLTKNVAYLSAEQALMKTTHFKLVESLNISVAGLQTLIGEQRDTIAELRDQIVALNKRIEDLSNQLRAAGKEPVKAE